MFCGIQTERAQLSVSLAEVLVRVFERNVGCVSSECTEEHLREHSVSLKVLVSRRPSWNVRNFFLGLRLGGGLLAWPRTSAWSQGLQGWVALFPDG